MICYHVALNDDTYIHRFQTKLTYVMICYVNPDSNLGQFLTAFQTKLTYVMICYSSTLLLSSRNIVFQTKLTYVMICYPKKYLYL